MPARPKLKSQKPKSHLGDLADFRVSLCETLIVNAKDLAGLQVVKAPREISDDIHAAGIDGAYLRTEARDPRNLAEAWNLSWLTALNLRLPHFRLARSRPKPFEAGMKLFKRKNRNK
jgi:hypothetical protein